MKNSVYCVFIASLILLGGCSSDSDNLSPNPFNLFSVTNGAIGVSLFPGFAWEQTTDPEGDAIVYDLYLDENTNPSTIYASSINGTTFNVTERLFVNTKYYWKVIARDSEGNPSQSTSIFNFTTRDLNLPLSPVTSDAAFGELGGMATATFLDDLWVIGGIDLSATDEVWNSSNGVSWTKRTEGMFPPRRDHTVEVFNDKLWVIAGGRTNSDLYNDAWYSTTGAFWTAATTSAPFAARVAHASVVFDDKLWVIGGLGAGSYMKDVWYSSDGASWTQATSSGPFPMSTGSQLVAFNGKMMLIGGLATDGSTFLNDIWESTDGVNWSQVTADPPFAGRYYHRCVVYDEKIWVIGGAFPELNDIWYSSDGAFWQQLTDNAPFSPRYRHGCEVLNDKIWVIGGDDYNDVWALD